MAWRRRSGLWRSDLLPGGNAGSRGHREASGGGGGALRTDREVAIIIRRGGELLMLHRSQDDYWHVVAGVVEDGETFAEAGRRELREETGLDAPIEDVHMPQKYRVPDHLRSEYRSGVDEVAIENFEVEAPPGWEPILNEEHDFYRWLSRAEAIAIAYWPETAELLAALGRRPTSS